MAYRLTMEEIRLTALTSGTDCVLGWQKGKQRKRNKRFLVVRNGPSDRSQF